MNIIIFNQLWYCNNKNKKNSLQIINNNNNIKHYKNEIIKNNYIYKLLIIIRRTLTIYKSNKNLFKGNKIHLTMKFLKEKVIKINIKI